MNYLPLLGILIIVLGFALRFNPMVVVPVAAIATGLLAGFDLVEVISKLGKAFNDSRLIAVQWIVLPVIGLLELYGLQQRARNVIASFRVASAGRLLILYLLYRQAVSAIGLHSTAGHAQTVRPLVAPMAVAAAEERHGPLDQATSDKVKAYAAATDNVGLFFGEDIFFAIGSIILIQQTLEAYGIALAPLQLALWAIPTAIAAFIIHSTRLMLLDRSLKSSPAFAGEGDRPKDGGGVLPGSARTPPPRSARSHSPENPGEDL
ncbi:MAG TPA: DUF969 domain-containing protein [Allosphingosinicella sp.]|jgi:uncharacterized membrane protein